MSVQLSSNRLFRVTVAQLITISIFAASGVVVAQDADSDAEDVLEEIVVVGYGTQTRSTITGSVASIDVDDAMKEVTHDPTISLQGRAPSVQVLTNGGIAGSDAKVLIRGTGTFGDTDPLFVIDGAFSSSGMSGLSAADIESIDILKDGAAAAIYGSRAANGVVLITTRKGVKGEPQIRINASYGYQEPSESLSYANAEQWRAFSNRVSANDGNPIPPEDASPVASSGVDNNWEDVWFDNAPISSIDVSISGGSDDLNYLTSFGHVKQEGIIDHSEFEKFTGRLNLGFENGRFELQENLGISWSKNNPNSIYGARGLARELVLLPTVPVTNSEGEFVVAGNDFYQETSPYTNPYALAADDTREIEELDIVGSISASYEFFDGLRYQLTLSGNYVSTDDFDKNSPYSYPVVGDSLTSSVDSFNPSLSESKADRFDYAIDNLIYFDKDFGDHSTSTVVGYSEFHEDFRLTGTDVIFNDPFEQQLTVVNGDATANGLELKSELRSYFARINYDYLGKYMLSASLRHDKSSKFASGNNSDTFPAFSAGWNVHEESFFPLDGVVSHLKVTAAYGELGANFIDPYQFSSVAFGPLPAIFGDNQNGPADRVFGRVTQLLDPNLTWETSTTNNFGVEVGLWDNSLMMTAEYFKRENEDILAPVPLPPSAGQTILINTGRAPDVNAATIENTGVEFTLSYSNEWRDVAYGIDFNLSTIDNEVTSLGENVVPIVGDLMSGTFDDRPTRTDTGLAVGTFWGYRTQGLDANGNFVFADTNSDGVVNDDDKVVLGDPFPDYTYGLSLTADYKDFDFSVFLEGSHGAEIFSQMKYQNYFLYSANVVTDALNAWGPDNTNTEIPRATINNRGGGNALPSDFYVEDGSYLRIRNVQVGYNLDDATANRFGLASIRVFLGAQNLHTFTDYSGYDPQVSSASLFDRGVDYRGYPNARTYTLGVNASF